MKRALLIFLFFSFFTQAYTPSEVLEARAQGLSRKINAYIERIPSKKTTLLTMFVRDLPLLQYRLIGTGERERMYLLEFLRRHLPGNTIIDTPDLLDDDGMGYTWTHAPKGFDILYFPYETPIVLGVDPEKKYHTLVNGTYFSRTEGGNYHAGILWFGGDRHTRFIDDDTQLTHIFCREKNGFMRVFPNAEYSSEETLEPCDIAFQFGPLIYASRGGKIEENLAKKTYIGSAHTRTVMVVFGDASNKQDIWFLTVYAKMTLEQVRNLVLAETRFIDTYKDIMIINLDGGSSVSYVSRTYPELTFGKSKQLPILFGIK